MNRGIYLSADLSDLISAMTPLQVTRRGADSWLTRKDFLGAGCKILYNKNTTRRQSRWLLARDSGLVCGTCKCRQGSKRQCGDGASSNYNQVINILSCSFLNAAHAGTPHRRQPPRRWRVKCCYPPPPKVWCQIWCERFLRGLEDGPDPAVKLFIARSFT